MNTDKLLRMKTVTNILLIISVILFLIALGVTYGPALLQEVQLRQDGQEYIELSEQNQPTDLADPDAVLPDDSTVPEEQAQDAILVPVTDLTPDAEQDATPVTDSIDQPQDVPGNDTPEQPSTPNDTPDTTTSPATNGAGLASYKAQNADFVAWLTIPGTKIDYPVVQSDNIDYYLTHTFEGTKSSLGTLFSLGNADYSGGRNIAIYGHHITGSGGKMFKPLLDFKDKSFWADHQTITLDTLNGSRTYRVFAVINMEQNEWDPSTATFADSEAFMAFVNRAREQALYDTGVSVSANDRILTLITCDRSFAGKDGRLIVMAVQQ